MGIHESNYVSELADLHQRNISEELYHMVGSGAVTIGLVRPMLEVSISPEWAECNPAILVEEDIFSLGVMARYNVRFDETSLTRFYPGLAEGRQSSMPARRLTDLKSRWEEFTYIMTNGYSTAFLLYDPDCDAINMWRTQIGHWDVESKRSSNTLRGKYALDNFNNIFHGSDSIGSVYTELGVLHNLVRAS